MGLSDVYGTVRTQILTMEPLPSASKAYSLVLQEECHRGLFLTHVFPDNTTLATMSRSSENQNLHRPFCIHCHKNGHTRDSCYTLHGFPPNYGHRRPKVYSSPKGSHLTVAATDLDTESNTDLHSSTVTPPSFTNGLVNEDGD